MRMQLRRYTRKTNAFSRKLEQHRNMLAIYFVWYNWARIHGNIRVTPAMEAGLCPDLRNLHWLAGLLEDCKPWYRTTSRSSKEPWRH